MPRIRGVLIYSVLALPFASMATWLVVTLMTLMTPRVYVELYGARYKSAYVDCANAKDRVNQVQRVTLEPNTINKLRDSYAVDLLACLDAKRIRHTLLTNGVSLLKLRSLELDAVSSEGSFRAALGEIH